MLARYFGPQIHTYLHLLGLFTLAMALPWSKALMSICILYLSLNFLLEADFKNSFQRLKSNKVYVGFLAWYLFLWIGLFWSEDLKFGVHDVKVKASIFAFATTILARPTLKKWQLYLVLIAFLGSMMLTSFFNFAQYNQWWGNREYDEIRGMSLYANHIRYALLVSMSVAISVFFYQKEKKYRIPAILLILWFTFYTVYSQVLTGYITLAGVFLTTIAFYLYQKSKVIGWGVVAVGLISVILVGSWIFTPIEIDYSKHQNLPEKTALGNPYNHDFSFVSSYTNEPMLLCVNREEAKIAWEKRSQKGILDLTPKGDRIEYVLYRYLTILGVPKDASGVEKLTDEEIMRIEKGIFYPKGKSLMAPMHNLRFQINNMKNPNGHSLLQRMEFWKTSREIISKNWLIGVGTGDVQLEFNKKYNQNNSLLLPENRNRSHNQFFATWIGVGIFGLLIFIWFHYKFIQFQLQNFQLLGLSFIVICIISYFFEDSLETQRVVSFFGLFFGLTAQNYLSNTSKSIL